MPLIRRNVRIFEKRVKVKGTYINWERDLTDNGVGMQFHIQVYTCTSGSGDTRTLDAYIQARDGQGANYPIPGAKFPTITEAGQYNILLYPGAEEIPFRSVSAVMPTDWSMVLVIAGTATVEYEVEAWGQVLDYP